MPADTTDEDDEGLHPAGDDPDWQESAYLAWRDPVSGLGGNHRIGNELNRETANLWCGVYHESGTRFRCNGEALPLVRLEEVGLCAGPQRLFHDGEQLRFVLDGDGCRADLEITDDGAAVLRQCPVVHRDGGRRRGPSSPTTSTSSAGSAARWSSTASRRRSTPRLAGPLVGRAPLGQLRLEPELRGHARPG